MLAFRPQSAQSAARDTSAFAEKNSRTVRKRMNTKTCEPSQIAGNNACNDVQRRFRTGMPFFAAGVKRNCASGLLSKLVVVS